MTERIRTQYDKEIAAMGAKGPSIRARHKEGIGVDVLPFVADARRAAQSQVITDDRDYELEKDRLMEWKPKDI